MLSLRGLVALVVVTGLGYVTLDLTVPANCSECSAMPEALVLQGALALWLLVLLATVVVAIVLAWRWISANLGG